MLPLLEKKAVVLCAYAVVFFLGTINTGSTPMFDIFKQIVPIKTCFTSATTNIIYNSMIIPMMLYCSPVYLGLPGVHQKFTKLEFRAYKTIKTQPQITNTITNKMKQRSAIEVFKHIHQLKKNNIIKFNVFQHNISTRGNGNRLVIPKSNNEAGR